MIVAKQRGVLALVAVAALWGPLMLPQASATPTGLLWGAYAATRPGEDERTAVLRLERTSGHRLEVVRDFLRWDDPFPTPFHTWLRDTGRKLVLSVRSARLDRTKVPWAQIATATPGTPVYARMVSWADRIKRYGAPVYFAFTPEPESSANQGMGTAPEFVAAWRSMRRVFDARGATNVKFMWVMTDYSFIAPPSDSRWAPRWYPGDAWVDAIAGDAYNWFTCRTGYKSTWRSLEQIIAPLRNFGRQHPHEELWLAEWGSVEDPATPGRKAQWIKAAQALFKRSDYAQFAGISYFDSYKRTECPWPVETSPSSLRAFGAMGADPFYGG